MPTVHLPPGPNGHFLVGNIPEINRDPLNFFSQCARNYGDFVRWQFGPFPAILLSHPSLIEQVLVTQYRNFAKSSVYRRGLRVAGNGLLTSETFGSVSAVWFNQLSTLSKLQPMVS